MKNIHVELHEAKIAKAKLNKMRDDVEDNFFVGVLSDADLDGVWEDWSVELVTGRTGIPKGKFGHEALIRIEIDMPKKVTTTSEWRRAIENFKKGIRSDIKVRHNVNFVRARNGEVVYEVRL